MLCSDFRAPRKNDPLLPSVAYCAHQVQNFDLSQRFWCRGLSGVGFNEQIFGVDEQVPERGQSDQGAFGPRDNHTRCDSVCRTHGLVSLVV